MGRRRSQWASLVLAVGLVLGARALAATPDGPDDQTITSNIQAKLFEDSVLKTRDIHVSTQNAIVTLTGTVNTDLEKAAVDRIASNEPGVRQVVDSLAVSAASPDAGSVTRGASANKKDAPLTVPSGTVVTVRMIDSIDSKVNQPGQEFAASLSSPVVVSDRVVFPQGSDCRVRLVEAKQSGHFKGSSELELELVSINANGTAYNVQSGYYTLNGASRGKRTAETVGGGAILGGLIGGIAGGGKGAAIGAGAGAATGAGVQAITHGAQVKIPSETKIDFTLKSPVTVGST